MNRIAFLASLLLGSWLALPPTSIPQPTVALTAQETPMDTPNATGDSGRDPQRDPEGLRARAAERIAEGSYQAALELLESIDLEGLELEDARDVRFRIADCRWRSALSTRRVDRSELDRARSSLQELLSFYEREEQRDQLFAELQESLGDSWWPPQGSSNWGAAWPHYEEALAWWGRSSDLEAARERYLSLVRRMTERSPYGGRLRANHVPRFVLDNALKIATTDADRARAHFFLGLHYQGQARQFPQRPRALEEFAQVMAFGREGEAGAWYDDALFASAEFLQNVGRATRDEQGQWRFAPDFVEALALYRRLVKEFPSGTSAHRRDAQGRIEGITRPQLGVSVDRFFVPGSEVPYRLTWRNVESVRCELYAVDLTQDLTLGSERRGNWYDEMPLGVREPVASWTHETDDDGRHLPGSARRYLDPKPKTGVYVLRAQAGGLEARALVLVSDVALTVKATGRDLLAWLVELENGKPVAGARLRIWKRFYDGKAWRFRDVDGTTAEDGTARFQLAEPAQQAQYFVAAALDGEDGALRQAFVEANAWARGSSDGAQWTIDAYADRAAYRPGETVHWKTTVRARDVDGDGYRTPAGEMLRWSIVDPRGTEVAKGEGELNAFGSSWGDLETTAAMTLGEYRVNFQRELSGGRRIGIGGATLFRLEEYKLPEYEVAVVSSRGDAQESDDGPPRFVLGDEVTVDVTGSYTFGGPVAGAKVEVFVYQRPLYRFLARPRTCGWYYEDEHQGHWWGGHGQQIVHQSLRTDAEGTARVSFETPQDAGQDYEYTIEARMVDASRREIVGRGTVRVTQREYQVLLSTDHRLIAPGGSATIDVLARDANERPVEAEGTLRVLRERWVEVWRDPRGKRILGDELERLRREGILPPPNDGGPVPDGWERVFAGYEKETVAETTLATDDEGQGRWSTTLAEAGTYRVTWVSEDGRGLPVEAELRLFVGNADTSGLGYNTNGLELIVDADTFVEGEEATLLLASDRSDRWVLFTVEAQGLLHYEVLRMEGTARFLRLPIRAAHVPNVWLSAHSVHGGRTASDTEQVVVPPNKHFLTIESSFEDEVVEPGSEGALRVSVRDHEGKPVATELSFSVSDDALSYIQSSYTRDPRQVFYGERNWLGVSTSTSLDRGAFVDVAEEEKEADDVASNRRKRLEETADLEALGYGASASEGWFLGKGQAAPMASRAMADGVANEAPARQGPGAGGGPDGGNVRVRTDFRSSALWIPDVVTGDDGTASVQVAFPDSTTRWIARVRGIDQATRVGSAETSARTRLPLIARLQAPRFFQVGDTCLVSGVVNNNTEAPFEARVSLSVDGLKVLGRLIDGELLAADAPGTISVPPGGSARVDWRVEAVTPGQAVLELAALSGEFGDAMRRSYPVQPHGMQAFEARAGRLDQDELSFTLPLPERAPGSTRVALQLSPSLAVTMLDALPYLVEYPYGCTEQTLSRFLPATIVAKTLRDRGLSAEDALTRAFGGIEVEHAGATHPKGKGALDELEKMTAAGLKRLYDHQRNDGSFAWWKGGDGDVYMTAYALWGLSLARDAGVDVRPEVLDRAAGWLANHVVEAERRPDLSAWSLHALAAYGPKRLSDKQAAFASRALDGLWEERERLTAASRALLTLAAVGFGRDEQAQVLVRNLANGVEIDRSPDTSIVQRGGGTSQPYVLATAHWGETRSWWRWRDGAIESTAFALRALLAVDPEHELVVPAMNWLVKNRRGAQWTNTRDTAICVLALNDYLERSDELTSEGRFEALVNGSRVATLDVTAANALAAPSTIEIPEELLRDGENEVVLRRLEGQGGLYFAAHASFFSLEEPLPARGNEVFVRRDYYQLVGRPTLLDGTVFERVPLRDGDTIESGTRVEVVLTVETKNDLEYLIFEDKKPAGFEAVGVKSGTPFWAVELRQDEADVRFGGDGDAEGGADRRRRGSGRTRDAVREDSRGTTGRRRFAHRELRDTHVAIFVDRMEQGVWQMRYDLRAEVPGSFHALPCEAQAMYVPEIRGNGAEQRVVVLDAE